MMAKKSEENKEALSGSGYQPEPEMPVLVTFREFLGILSRESRFESVGAFSYWMIQQGVPKKLSVERWMACFDEFVNRKV